MNTSSNYDTIAAVATPPGQGGVGIVRISGKQAKDIAEKILAKKITTPRQVIVSKFYDKQSHIIDHGIAIYFKAPHSFTGEDVVELQGHGGPVILDLVLKTAVTHGARLALPGEFSQRAFLNDKIDLVQAEAIADLIASQSEAAARAAMRSLEGEFSQKIHDIVSKLIELRMYVEAAIDFPEEEIDFLSDGVIAGKVNQLYADIQLIQQNAKQGRLLRDGITVVIAGQPNAGKSSLLNALAGQDIAIVTDIAGTTRDVLKEKINCDGIPLNIVDTAGIRESSDIVEQEGIKRAKHAVSQAEIILLVIDITKFTHDSLQAQWQELKALVSTHAHLTVIANKIDLLEPSQIELKLQAIKNSFENIDIDIIELSAKKQIGLDKLKNHLKKSAGATTMMEDCFIARRRHLEAIEVAKQFVEKAKIQLEEFKAGELVAEELRQAQLALNEITGEFTPDDLLGKIFGSFCIGK